MIKWFDSIAIYIFMAIEMWYEWHNWKCSHSSPKCTTSAVIATKCFFHLWFIVRVVWIALVFYVFLNCFFFFFVSLVGCTAPNSNSTIPCNGHGKCETKNENGQSCLCYYGFTGPFCEHSKWFVFSGFVFIRPLIKIGLNLWFALNLKISIDLNDCLPNPCKNNGMCLDGDGKFTCKCAPGWSGR